MTVRRMREARAGMTSAPMGSGWNDPSAIPPPGMFNQQRAGVMVTTHTALQVDAVFTALRVLSNAVIKMGPPRAYTNGYDEYNRPYRQWLKVQPGICTNTFGTMFQFDGTARSVISLGLFGEAFWATIERDDYMRPSAIEVLNPAFVEMKNNKVTGALEYWYGAANQKVQIKNQDMTHIPFMAMPGGQRGLNSIEYAGVAYALALAAMEYGQRWFSQGASPSYILSTEQKLGDMEVTRIAEKFLIEHSGLQAAHLPLVVDSGLKVERIQSSPDEAQYLQTLEYARMVIAAWFGLPSHLMGGGNDKGNVWGKTVQEQSFQMVDFTLSGYMVRLEEAYSLMLPNGIFAAYDDSQIQRAAAMDNAAEILAVRQGQVKTSNDLRIEKYRMPPLPGGDTITAPLASNASPPPETRPTSATTPTPPPPTPDAADDDDSTGGNQ